MLANINAEEDNDAYVADLKRSHTADDSPSKIPIFASAPLSYYTWLHPKAAMNGQCPVFYLLFTCLAALPGEAFFQGARQEYLSNDISRHLANIFRLDNDYGSVARDHAEGNLNSLNFPEFHEAREEEQDIERLKETLLFIADHERESLSHAMEKLTAEMKSSAHGGNKMATIKVYVDAILLYGQMYRAKDLSSPLR
jgi:hypothetical protein